MKNTCIIIGERTSVGMMLQSNTPPPNITPRREVIASPFHVLTHLKNAGYSRLYLPNDFTIVVGVSERDAHPDHAQATLDTVCADALGPKPQDRHSSVAGVNSFHGGRGR